MSDASLDTGTGYTRKPSTFDAALTEVGRGTPMGELLRRYWHPVGLVADADTTPKPVRALGEDLILFRDGNGRRRPGAWRAAAIAAPRSTTARSRSAASAAAITAGCSTWKAIAWSSRASPDGGRIRERMRQPWYPVRGALRPDLRLYGPARAEAGAAALRVPRGAGRRRVRRGRRHQHRLGRRHDHAVQLAAALRERRRPVPRPDPARVVQRRAVRRRRWASCRR